MLRALQVALERLSFRQKIVLLPTLAAIAIGFVLVVDAAMGVVNERRLEHLQHGHYPSLQLHHHLSDILAVSQQRLQDAVAATDLDQLDAADSLAASFHAAILSAPSIGEQERRRFADLDREFSAYYRMARRTSERMIRGDVTDDAIALQARMGARYNSLRDHLLDNTARDSVAVANAFVESRANGRLTWVSSAILMGACVLALVLLSRYTAGSLLRAITGAVQVADRLAEGDMTTAIPPAGDDEVGHLLRSMGRMTDNLSRVIGDLRESEADNR
ncbi:MAG TPA: methyl-accepting chemotaxis protein, partial [Gemmatimonadaceae bacterium]|nr:methyl-accepting chemotaxis protein [Gemmatimonadaceae bacterium]